MRSAISLLMAQIDVSTPFRASGDSSSITPRMPKKSLSIADRICLSSVMLGPSQEASSRIENNQRAQRFVLCGFSKMPGRGVGRGVRRVLSGDQAGRVV